MRQRTRGKEDRDAQHIEEENEADSNDRSILESWKLKDGKEKVGGRVSSRRKSSRKDENLDNEGDKESKFINDTQLEPIPKKFKLPTLPMDEGMGHLPDFIKAYKNKMEMHNTIKAALCKALYWQLGLAGRIWYDKLPSRSIESFKELAMRFKRHFISNKKVSLQPNSLSSIR